MPYEDVTYWNEMAQIFDWTRTNVHSTINICWGAMAAIYHFHGLPKYPLEREGLRRLPPPQPGAGLAFPHRLLG